MLLFLRFPRSPLQQQWKSARNKVGVQYRLHDLRHLGATLAAAAGASTKEIMRRIGHSSPTAALRYQHAADDRDKVVAEALVELAPKAPIVAMRKPSVSSAKDPSCTGVARTSSRPQGQPGN